MDSSVYGEESVAIFSTTVGSFANHDVYRTSESVTDDDSSFDFEGSHSESPSFFA